MKNDNFKVISTKGYSDGYYWDSDGYYWDCRIWFSYKGEEYTYMRVWSCYGWIECAEEIAKGIIGLPEWYRDSRFSSDVFVNKEELICYVKMLQKTGENEISLLDEE